MNKSNLLVSIIIPTYNVEKYLEKCIISCTKQKYKNIEILVIDDGSYDTSGEIANRLSKKDKRIKVFHKENGGVSSARNEGIRRSTGDYVVFVDADDYIDNQFIEYMLDLCIKTNSEFCFSKNCYKNKEETQVENDQIIKIDNSKATALLLSPDIEVGCWNKMYKKELLKNNNIYFSEKLFFGEGLDFICRVSQKAKNICVGEEKHYFYRKNNLSSATTNFNYYNFINGEKALLKIKKDFSKIDEEVDEAWRFHYTLFCINAIIGIIINRNMDNYKEKISSWKRKVKKYGFKLIFRGKIDLKQKIKILVAIIFPKLLAIRSLKVKNYNIKESV